MAALHLASNKIQKCWRGHIIRKHKADLRKYLEGREKSKGAVNEKTYTGEQKLRAKFLSSKQRVPGANEDEAFKHFCATKIAATFRMGLTKRLFKFHRFSMYHVAAIEIQGVWKRFVSRHPKKSKEDIAAHKIQMQVLLR